MATTITRFNDDWYHKFIDQEMENLHEEVTYDGALKARAILSGAAMIAQSIDLAFGGGDRYSTRIPLDSIAESFAAIAESLINKK